MIITKVKNRNINFFLKNHALYNNNDDDDEEEEEEDHHHHDHHHNNHKILSFPFSILLLQPRPTLIYYPPSPYGKMRGRDLVWK